MDTERFRLLCVDDESNLLDIFRRVFRGTHEVLTAGGGQAAIDILAREPVDVVLSDQRMPEVTGVEVLKFARQQQPDAVRILVTAYADMASLVKSVNEAGIFKYLTKPLDLEELQATVAEALESVRSERRLKAMIPSPQEFLLQCERDAAIVQRLSDDIAIAYNRDFRQVTTARILRIFFLFTKFNFENQDRFMAFIRYPEADAHRNQHKEMADQLELVKQAYSLGDDVYDDVRDLYRAFVGEHFQEFDGALDAYIKENFPDIQ